MRLQTAYQAGIKAALTKFALAPVSPADALVAGVEGGKDMPPPDALPSDPVAPFDLSGGAAEAVAQFGG